MPEIVPNGMAYLKHTAQDTGTCETEHSENYDNKFF